MFQQITKEQIIVAIATIAEYPTIEDYLADNVRENLAKWDPIETQERNARTKYRMLSQIARIALLNGYKK